MNQAIVLAKRAFLHEDVPIGAVIVRDGKIIARGENQVQLKKNPTLHAEIVAINRACKKLGTKFLDGCDIYVSLEPCAMCATAISFARINNIYYAASDEKGGGITSTPAYMKQIFIYGNHLFIRCQNTQTNRHKCYANSLRCAVKNNAPNWRIFKLVKICYKVRKSWFFIIIIFCAFLCLFFGHCFFDRGLFFGVAC